jgi:hypothetical protein
MTNTYLPFGRAGGVGFKNTTIFHLKIEKCCLLYLKNNYKVEIILYICAMKKIHGYKRASRRVSSGF